MRDSGVLEKSCDRGSNPRGANTSLFIFCDMKYYMELFMPSERILKEIGWDKDGQRIYFTNVANASESVLRGTVASAKTIITDVYRFQFEIADLSDDFLLRPVVRLIWEALRNVFSRRIELDCAGKSGEAKIKCMNFYGRPRDYIQSFLDSRKKLPFTYGLFIAINGICHGFQEGDRYFTREDIKQRFENKIPLTEFDMDVSSRRVGVRDYIYNLSDIIEVDTANGILFCVQYFGNFREWREHKHPK